MTRCDLSHVGEKTRRQYIESPLYDIIIWAKYYYSSHFHTIIIENIMK